MQALAAEREHVERIRQKLTVAELHKLEQQAIKAADADQQQALQLPAYRNIQLKLLVDKLILDRHPFAKPQLLSV